jgi:hypothetical protein
MAESEDTERDGQEEMPDPIIGTVLAKAVGAAAGSESEKAATGLFMRVFGPSADEVGEALRRYTAYKLRNVGRIVENADAKSSAKPAGGMVNTRVAFVLLEEGSLCDDELMANYLGGVLAGGRSADGRDDRGISWSRLVTSLSSLQIKAHYLLYREWAVRLAGVEAKSMQSHNLDRYTLIVDTTEFLGLLVSGTDVDPWEALNHSIYGLVTAGLIGDYWWDSRKRSNFLSKRLPFSSSLGVAPTPTGLELYGWAQGLPGITPFEFPKKAKAFDTEPPIPRISGAMLKGKSIFAGRWLSLLRPSI